MTTLSCHWQDSGNKPSVLARIIKGPLKTDVLFFPEKWKVRQMNFSVSFSGLIPVTTRKANAFLRKNPLRAMYDSMYKRPSFLLLKTNIN